ncbi:MAG TPA: TIGR03118 family protein [Lacunisphaera sp.]
MRRLIRLAIGLAVLPVSALHAQTTDSYNSFSQTNLVADTDDFNAEFVNPDMVDAWGIALRPPGAGGHIWVNDAVGGTSLEYIGDVAGMPLHQDGLTKVTLHQPHFTDHGYAFATGIVYNAAKDLAGQPVEFPVPNYNVTEPGQVIQPGDTTQTGQPAQDVTNPNAPVTLPNTTGSSAFVFVTEDGCINCWRSNTQTDMTDVPLVVDYSKTSTYFPYAANCVFTGCAMTTNAAGSPAYQHNGAGTTGNLLFAADQRNNVIEVFENRKEPTDTSTNAWTDVTTSFHFQALSHVGDLHVFNIQDIAGHLYVTYAEFNPDGDEGQEQVNGQGLGHVAEFNEDGTLVREFNDGANTPNGLLNQPWGVAIAPAGFGKFGGDVLVADFGSGNIMAFDPNTGNFVDYLRDSTGTPISIDGIWGLTFGNGVSLGDANTLYFTAGPNSEQDGVFGKLTFDPMPTDTPVMPPVALALMGMMLFLVGAAVWPRLRMG